MALLQIAEPGQSPQPHQRRLAVGIDLGTTNSLVAAVRSGLAEPLADAAGKVILPSAVRYHADRVEVGASAKGAAAQDPLNTVLADEYGVVIGTSHHEPMARAHVEWERYGEGAWDWRTNAANLSRSAVGRYVENSEIVQ